MILILVAFAAVAYPFWVVLCCIPFGLQLFFAILIHTKQYDCARCFMLQCFPEKDASKTQDVVSGIHNRDREG